MANSNSRSNQARDPLAELARLIGQGQASGGQSRNARELVRPRAPAARATEWAPETRFAPEEEAHYAPPRLSAAATAPRQAPDRAYQDPGFQDHDDQDDQGYSNGPSYLNSPRYSSGQSYSSSASYSSSQSHQDDRYSQHQDLRGYRDDGYQQPDYQSQDYGRQDQRQAHQHQDYQPQDYQPQDYQPRLPAARLPAGGLPAPRLPARRSPEPRLSTGAAGLSGSRLSGSRLSGCGLRRARRQPVLFRAGRAVQRLP